MAAIISATVSACVSAAMKARRSVPGASSTASIAADRFSSASSDRYRAWPIRTAPFYAIPICAAITNTMGDIVVDGNGAVLDQSDTPMPGLFAAGSTVGGLDGGPNAGYVGGLIKATIPFRAAEAASSK
jgi:fumarate reductase flavoprotein subunit